MEVQLGTTRQTFDAEGRLTLNGDLSTLQPDALEVLGPPLWPVEVFWDAGRRWRLEPMSLGAGGRLDSAELLARTAERRQRSTLGDLHLDFGELGRAVLRHSRRPDPADLQKRLARMVYERASTLAGLGGQFPLIRGLWLDPLLALLGYDIQEASEADLANAPALTTALAAARPRCGRVRPHRPAGALGPRARRPADGTQRRRASCFRGRAVRAARPARGPADRRATLDSPP